TALALIAFQAAGFGPDDPHVAKGVKALLKMQHPTGYWNAASQTGFVTTSYSMHALSRLFPVDAPKYTREHFQLNAKSESQSELISTLRKIRELSMIEEPELMDIAVQAVEHQSPLVRFYAMIALGGVPSDSGIDPLMRGLGDDAKIVREAAHWGLRQSLIDDRGWSGVEQALKSSDDYVRESAMKALLMRVDTVMPGSSANLDNVTAWLAHGINDDVNPAVRAWSMRAAWNWWIWNPPVRSGLNQAWIKLYRRPETNLLVENAIRYQSHALFIANGHRANVSSDHQYQELKTLFADLKNEMEATAASDPETHRRIVHRIVATAATFYNTAGGDGGPGQMGYATPGQGDLFGAALLAYLQSLGSHESADQLLLQSALEGAANIPHRELQQKLIDYSLNGPEELRPIAASSISDPRSAQLVAVPELLEPLLKQIERGAAEPTRRPQLSDPVLRLFSRVKWVIPETVEQQREIFTYMVPKMSDYHSAEEIANLADPAEKTRREKEMESAWYLVRGLGEAVGNNPDLHIDLALEFIPHEFQNPLQVRYWLPSVEWILTYKTMLPEVKVEAGQVPPIDPLEELRSRVLSFFIAQLSEAAHPENRELAVRQAQATALRRNPEVLNALDQLLKYETREEVVKMAKNVLSTGRENFVKDLEEAVKQENPLRFAVSAEGKVELPTEFVQDFEYFRDYVSPEMNRVLRSDQRSCFACHGVPGRVPPLTLHNPDDVGYLPVDQILANYRLLQGRIDLKEIEKSKLLRKPLNVQTGKEDGHQGGRRYQPDDPGYLILRSWVLNQGTNHKLLGFTPISSAAGKQ
ncbi:MAG: HEAT repeat domain-containing protein, partial [Planctomycetaceae bacterium]